MYTFAVHREEPDLNSVCRDTDQSNNNKHNKLSAITIKTTSAFALQSMEINVNANCINNTRFKVNLIDFNYNLIFKYLSLLTVAFCELRDYRFSFEIKNRNQPMSVKGHSAFFSGFIDP